MKYFSLKYLVIVYVLNALLQSEKLRDACYMSDWINCGMSVRKTLFIIMERTKRPLQLSAANFIVLSLDTLVSVSQSFLYLFVSR